MDLERGLLPLTPSTPRPGGPALRNPQYGQVSVVGRVRAALPFKRLKKTGGRTAAADFTLAAAAKNNFNVLRRSIMLVVR